MNKTNQQRPSVKNLLKDFLNYIYSRAEMFHFRLTKCTFHKFGTSGELEKHDALCILPLNIFNEKIYIFLWFWMLILTSLTSLVVVYRFEIYQFIRSFILSDKRCLPADGITFYSDY